MDANETFFKSIPVGWANYGVLSRMLAGIFKIPGPPILVVSLPRSGSSWVGEILGSAKNAAYLREPITQTHFARGGKLTLVDVNPNCPPVVYKDAGGLAFPGVPAFPAPIVIFPEQWELSERKNKKLVIKEVNPLVFEWLLPKYKPRVIFLVRHPAAVALSWHKLGWLTTPEGLLFSVGRLLEGPLRPWKDAVMSAASFWECHGALQGAVLKQALNCLEGYVDARIVMYEELCNSYSDKFRDLFRFSKLQWNRHIDELIAAKSTGDDSINPYGTIRKSKEMPDAWKNKISSTDLEALRKYFCSFDLPFYNSPGDW